jgi:hypothetical protein
MLENPILSCKGLDRKGTSKVIQRKVRFLLNQLPGPPVELPGPPLPLPGITTGPPAVGPPGPAGPPKPGPTKAFGYIVLLGYAAKSSAVLFLQIVSSLPIGFLSKH